MDKIIVDHNALDQYHDILGAEAKDFLLDIINTFLIDAPKQLILLDQSLTAQDAPSFQRAAHTLKSNLSIIGAVEMAKVCLLLEERGAAGDLIAVDSLLIDINANFNILKAELLNKMDGLQEGVN